MTAERLWALKPGFQCGASFELGISAFFELVFLSRSRPLFQFLAPERDSAKEM
jgi:hypothetical protein